MAKFRDNEMNFLTIINPSFDKPATITYKTGKMIFAVENWVLGIFNNDKSV
jgi:hypothetical protein